MGDPERSESSDLSGHGDLITGIPFQVPPGQECVHYKDPQKDHLQGRSVQHRERERGCQQDEVLPGHLHNPLGHEVALRVADLLGQFLCLLAGIRFPLLADRFGSRRPGGGAFAAPAR